MNKAALSLLTTACSWDDLIVTKKALEQVKTINSQLKKNLTVKSNQKPLATTSPLSPVLFYSTRSAEQIKTAALIGKEINKPAYSIDLSRLVSIYIGETEKNLDTLFKTAEKKGWILFFDEADALFGKRTDVKDSHDRYANLDITNLLQRMENYPGLALLATNKKSNIDPVFTRRLRYVINFPRPKKKNDA